MSDKNPPNEEQKTDKKKIQIIFEGGSLKDVKDALKSASDFLRSGEVYQTIKRNVHKDLNPNIKPLVRTAFVGKMYFSELAKQEGFESIENSPYAKELSKFEAKALEIEDELVGSFRKSITRGWKNLVETGHPSTEMQNKIRDDLLNPLLEKINKEPIIDKEINYILEFSLSQVDMAMGAKR